MDDKKRQMLRDCAVKAAGHAYSPYSKFRVGAAVMDAEGKIYAGCNVENASYSLTQCAERNAIGTAIAAGVPVGQLTVLVIYKAGNHPLPPCGACRQVMHETMAVDSRVIAICDSSDTKEWSKNDYLPDAFDYQKYR